MVFLQQGIRDDFSDDRARRIWRRILMRPASPALMFDFPAGAPPACPPGHTIAPG
jgi:hypothetical protein